MRIAEHRLHGAGGVLHALVSEFGDVGLHTSNAKSEVMDIAVHAGGGYDTQKPAFLVVPARPVVTIIPGAGRCVLTTYEEGPNKPGVPVFLIYRGTARIAVCLWPVGDPEEVMKALKIA